MCLIHVDLKRFVLAGQVFRPYDLIKCSNSFYNDLIEATLLFELLWKKVLHVHNIFQLEQMRIMRSVSESICEVNTLSCSHEPEV